MTDENDPKEIHPFYLMNRGEDTIAGVSERVIFSDFSPKPVPADTPDEVVPVPKDLSATVSVDSGQTSSDPSEPVTPPEILEIPAPDALDPTTEDGLAAAKGAGKPSPSATSKQTSSSVKKTG